MELTPDALDLTLDEIETIEDIVDVPAAKWGEARQGKLLKAMLLVVRQRTDPKATLADVGKVKVSELEAELYPTGGEGTAAS